jgi:hypothetical protein
MKEAIRNAKARPIRTVLIIFSGILGFTAVAALIYYPALSAENSWQGYSLLLVDAEADLDPVLDALTQFGVDHISSRSSIVHVSDFSGTDEVPLSQIEHRLDRADPRYDPYIASLGRYFRGYYEADAWHVLYLNADSPALFANIQLSTILKPLGVRYRTPEWSLFWFILGPVMFGLYVVILTQRIRKQRWLVILTTLPMMILAMRAPQFGLAAALVLLPGWIILATEVLNSLSDYLCTGTFRIDKPRVVSGAAFFGAGLLVALLLSALHPNPTSYLIFILLLVLAAIGITFGVLSIGLLRSLGNEHRVYRPLQILRGKVFGGPRDVTDQPASVRTILLIALAVLPALVISSVSENTMEVPLPAQVSEAEAFTLSDIGILASRKLPGQLPDLSDYITHRAYQDALLYSRSWVYPSEGSAVGVTNYAVRDGVVRPTRTPAVAFGTDWFEGVLNEASSNGIVALLLAQGRPVVAFRPEAIESASARLIRRFGLVVFLLSPLLFLRLNLTTQFFYGMRNLLLRRKRQTA